MILYGLILVRNDATQFVSLLFLGLSILILLIEHFIPLDLSVHLLVLSFDLSKVFEDYLPILVHDSFSMLLAVELGFKTKTMNILNILLLYLLGRSVFVDREPLTYFLIFSF
jgi:hypothetical protein